MLGTRYLDRRAAQENMANPGTTRIAKHLWGQLPSSPHYHPAVAFGRGSDPALSPLRGLSKKPRGPQERAPGPGDATTDFLPQ